MKIGILTYHRALNYGALLQAIALRHTIATLGHDAYFIDYWPKYHQDLYRPIPKKPFTFYLRHIWGFMTLLCKYPIYKKWYKNTQTFIAQYIDPYCTHVEDVFDIAIYGSDQIWRKQPTINQYNPLYWGIGIQANRHISYAASIDKIPQMEEDLNTFKSLLQNMDIISVRENALMDAIRRMGFSVHQTIDPTLLVNSQDWDKLIPDSGYIPKKPYLLYYCIREGYTENNIKHLAKILNLDYVLIDNQSKRIREDKHHLSTISPDQFITLIRHASYIVTTSFHGTAFAINYHKPFCVYCQGASERITSLLEVCSLTGCWISNKQLLSHYVKHIDYSMVDRKIEPIRQASIDFLHSVTQEN